MSEENQSNQVEAPEIPEDLQEYLRLISGLELCDNVIDNGQFEGSGAEAVAAARGWLRKQHKAVVALVEAHPQFDLVKKPEAEVSSE